MHARPALVAVVAVLVVAVVAARPAAVAVVARQLYNQDPRTFVLGWRGVLAFHVIAIDTWFLAGFGVRNLPFAFRMHWATEPVWIFVSFSCISIGTPELLHVFQFRSTRKVPPWERPGSLPVPPQGAPGGSAQPGTPRARRRLSRWALRHCLGCPSCPRPSSNGALPCTGGGSAR